MRRFFLFAVLWTALFGPGHVLAACPMASSSAGHGVHAPCHSDDAPATPTTARDGHDCCAWLAPSSGAGKFFTSRGDAPFDQLAAAGFAPLVPAAWNAQLFARPPPSTRYTLHTAACGGDTFLRTGRLRL